MTNYLPILDVDEENALRCSEPVTQQAAIGAAVAGADAMKDAGFSWWRAPIPSTRK